MTVISMSHAERHRLTVIMDLVEARITAPQAAAQLRLTERPIWRLRRRFVQNARSGACDAGSSKTALLAWCPANGAGPAIGASILRSR
jgi:hypothetical protein